MTSTDSKMYHEHIRHGQRHFFTLIEIMVASIVFMLVLVVVVAFSREMVNSWERLQREQKRFTNLMSLDRALDGMLTNVIDFKWRDEEKEEFQIFQGEVDRVQFAYLHNLNSLDDGALRFVQLQVADNQLLALYQERPFLTAFEPGEEARVSMLAEGIDDISLSYADWVPDQGVDWLDEWDVEREELPLAFMITVRWLDGREESWLRRTAASGFRERFGRWKAPEEI